MASSIVMESSFVGQVEVSTKQKDRRTIQGMTYPSPRHLHRLPRSLAAPPPTPPPTYPGQGFEPASPQGKIRLWDWRTQMPLCLGWKQVALARPRRPGVVNWGKRTNKICFTVGHARTTAYCWYWNVVVHSVVRYHSTQSSAWGNFVLYCYNGMIHSDRRSVRSVPMT